LVALAVALVAFGWLLYEYGRNVAGYSMVEAHQRQAALAGQVAELEAEKGRLQAQVAVLEQAAEIDRRAYEEVDRTLADLQNEMLEMRQEVAFYRGIVNSEDVAPGLRIQSFKLRQADAAQFQYRLVLTQLASTKARIQGKAEIALSGLRNGAETDLPAVELLSEAGTADLRFSFRNFQELRGVLNLPAGFIPLRVHLRAVPKDGGVVERTFSWTDVAS
jgi:hypothetical protein